MVEREANEAYEAYLAHVVMRDGRRPGGRPTPYEPPEIPAGKINTTDPDSRNVKTPRSYTAGYNAQAVVNERLEYDHYANADEYELRSRGPLMRCQSAAHGFRAGPRTGYPLRVKQAPACRLVTRSDDRRVSRRARGRLPLSPGERCPRPAPDRLLMMNGNKHSSISLTYD